MTPPADPTAGDACPHMMTCELYTKFRSKSALNAWITVYCRGTYSRCERYKLSAEGSPVPISLLPNGETLGGLA